MATVRDQHHSVVSGQSHHAAADLHIDVLLLSPQLGRETQRENNFKTKRDHDTG